MAGLPAATQAQDRDVVTEFSGPAGSSKPALWATAAGDLVLSWLERASETEWVLRVANRRAGRWFEPQTVGRSNRFFVNWADFPSVVETSTGTWLAHWLEKTAAKSYAYHVRLAASTDRGRTWSTPLTAHTDRSPTEHGFVAMVPGSDGSVAIAWLDGARMTGDSGSMSVRTATWSSDGRMGRETVIDGRTCECCQVAMTRAAGGLVVAFRDRSDTEIRDIAVAREIGGRWMPSTTVHRDGWQTPACPVNGPSIDAAANEVVVAWFTAADGQSKVHAAFSHDGGASFGRPIAVDEGRPLGRVQVRRIGPGAAAVTWLEVVGKRAMWKVRRITPGGTRGRPVTLGTTERTRHAGFPRVVIVNRQLYAAWSEPGAEGRVRVVRAPVASLAR